LEVIVIEEGMTIVSTLVGDKVGDELADSVLATGALVGL